jgi:hypothetical protein
MNWKKLIAGTGIGAAVIGVIAYASRIKKTGSELESVVTAKLHSLKLDGLTIRLDVLLKNPSAGSLKIKFPVVKVIYEDKTIGSSDPVNQDITIPAYGEARIEAIMVKLPITGLFSLGSGLLSLLTKKQPAKISVKTLTTIDLGWKKVPYETTVEKTINPLS